MKDLVDSNRSHQEVGKLVSKIKQAYVDIDNAVLRYIQAVTDLKNYSRSTSDILPYGIYANACLKFSGGLTGHLRKSSGLSRTLVKVEADVLETARLKAKMLKEVQDRKQHSKEVAWLPPTDESFDEIYSEVVEDE